MKTIVLCKLISICLLIGTSLSLKSQIYTFSDVDGFEQAIGCQPLVENFDSYPDGTPIPQLFNGGITFNTPAPTIINGNWNLFGTQGGFFQGGLIPEPRFTGQSLVLHFPNPVKAFGANVFDDFDGTPFINEITLTLTSTLGTITTISENFNNVGDCGFLGGFSPEGIVKAEFSIDNSNGNLEIDLLRICECLDVDGDDQCDDTQPCGDQPICTYTDLSDFEQSIDCQPALEDFDSYSGSTAISQLFNGAIVFNNPLPSIFYGNWNIFGTQGDFLQGSLIPEPRFMGQPLVLHFPNPVKAIGANVFDDFDGTPFVNVITLKLTSTSGAIATVSENFGNVGDCGFLGGYSQEGIVKAEFSIDNTDGNLEIDLLRMCKYLDPDQEDLSDSFQAVDTNTPFAKPRVAPNKSNQSATANQSMLLFPNPASGHIKLQFPTAKTNPRISIYNNLGQLKFKQTFPGMHNFLQLNLPEEQFANGIYILELRSGDDTQTEKFHISN